MLPTFFFFSVKQIFCLILKKILSKCLKACFLPLVLHESSLKWRPADGLLDTLAKKKHKDT